jgi:hypothetical protein
LQAMNYFENYLRGRQYTVFPHHKPLEIQSKHHYQTRNRLTKAFLKYDFEISYKNGSKMHADFLKGTQSMRCKFFLNSKACTKKEKICQSIQKHMHAHKNNFN